ncbi:hypothetical protein Ae406Ps2_6443 [Pseudonocardia sp. Ae406_Ps2]|nr:hypothetical protein Ae406Ps2_6443 [Pseudonocardia sp. Ae406_Ps2]
MTRSGSGRAVPDRSAAVPVAGALARATSPVTVT